MIDREIPTETVDCPIDGCEWSNPIPSDWGNVEYMKEERAEMHYEQEHCGRAKIRVVLEKEVMLHPEQELQSIIDDMHDSMAEKEPIGYEVAYAFGEITKEPDND